MTMILAFPSNLILEVTPGFRSVLQFLQKLLFSSLPNLTLYLKPIFLASSIYRPLLSGCFLNSFSAKLNRISILSLAIFCCQPAFLGFLIK